MRALLHRLASLASAFLLLAAPAAATWSIVAVDRRTGEVCISSATCLVRIDLSETTPVLLVGHGGGVAQAAIDSGENKVRIWEGFLAGDDPATILARIRDEDVGFNARQFGIVDVSSAPLTFTGGAAGVARTGVVGVVGDIAYAIQGNVLASNAVITECEAVLRSSTGDLGQRVLAAMVRARELGGDGRCSCGGVSGGCGTPPADFRKSAHVAFLTVARVGDVDGDCAVGANCASGDYYLELSIQGRDGLISSPDPVDQLVERYAEWRASRVGLPDGLLSRARSVDSLPADGLTEREVVVELVDVDGEPLALGGTTLAVGGPDGASLLGTAGPVVDRGDGTYAFVLRAPVRPGLERVVVTATTGAERATLWPPLEVRYDEPRMLHAGRDTLSAAEPEQVPLVVDVPRRGNGKYWLVGSLSGAVRQPHGRGMPLPPGVRGILPARSPFFPAPPAELDARGRAETTYEAPPSALRSLIGMRLELTARVVGRGKPLDSNTVGFAIVP